MARFEKVILVPQTRFYTKIDLKSGEDGQEDGRIRKEFGRQEQSTSWSSINRQFSSNPKHTVNKIISPEENQTGDFWRFMFRAYGLADVYENKVKGIYLHANPS